MVRKIVKKFLNNWWEGLISATPNLQGVIQQTGSQAQGSSQQLTSTYIGEQTNIISGTQQDLQKFNQYNINTTISNDFSSVYKLMKQQKEESNKRCEELRKNIDMFPNIVKNILNDIKIEEMNKSYSIYGNNEENLLTEQYKIGNIIAEHIKKYDFANKLEGIINNDNTSDT